MSDEFAELSGLALLSLIGRVESELKRRKAASTEKPETEMQQRLKASGLELSDLLPEAARSGKERNQLPLMPR